MRKIDDYLTTAKAADMLGVSENTVRTWAAAGKLPMRRNPANGYRLFLKQDLQAFLDRVESGVCESALASCAQRRP